MNIAIIMMQKNEGAMLKDWVEYHSSYVGKENIYIFDNGSTDQFTLKLLKSYEMAGYSIDYSKNQKEHFIKKGAVILDKIRELEKIDKYTYFFPMDCDEFLACIDDNGELSIDISEIKEVLSGLTHRKEVFAIKHSYADSPAHPDHFLPQKFRKTFFLANTCAFLDEGFHNGKTFTTDEKLYTKIVYFHLHNKPHSEYQVAAKEKLRERITDFSRESLMSFFERRGPGFHLIPKMLMSEAEFNTHYKIDGRVYFPQFRKKLKRLNEKLLADPIAKPFEQKRIVTGFIDKISINNRVLTLSGWGYGTQSLPLSEISVVIDGKNTAVWELTRTNRDDVKITYPSAPIDCGFIIKVILPQAASKVEAFSIADEKGLIQHLAFTSKAREIIDHILGK